MPQIAADDHVTLGVPAEPFARTSDELVDLVLVTQ